MNDTLRPVCAETLYQIAAGSSERASKCVWQGRIRIYAINTDAAKAADLACRPTLTGNPIDVGTTAKLQVEPDFRDPRGLLDVTRTYTSAAGSGANGWHFNWTARAGMSGSVGAPPRSVSITGLSGRRLIFDRYTHSGQQLPAPQPDADVNDVLTLHATGSRVRRVREGWVEHYDQQGKLLRIDYSDGRSVTLGYGYSDYDYRLNELVVSDHWSRAIVFPIESFSSRHLLAALPNGGTIGYAYDSAGRISSAHLADGAIRLYHYDEPEHMAGASFPIALTGISEQGPGSSSVRFSIYKYDALGRAISSEHAGEVNHHAVNYATAYQQSVVTDPRGTQRTTNLTAVAGNVLPTSHSQPAGAGCGPASSAITYDARANVTSRTDFNGLKTCYAYDPTRNVETKRVEGAAASVNCAAALSAPPAGARLISTEWHPDWDLRTRVAEPKRITTTIYNGYGATCAPVDALVDGRPIAVACLRTEQGTGDETGVSGFSAATLGAPRTASYTHTRYGQILTATDPNDRTTVVTYYPDDDPDLGKRGSVATIINPANHLTEITDYNLLGQPTRVVDPNGLVTVLTYDLRTRLRTHAAGSAITRFDYHPATGRMTQAELPDGATVGYSYDDAHRLTSIVDHKGNRIDYTLDPMGNRIAEQVRDPGGVLVQNIGRVIDALNRVERLTGVAN